MVYASFELYDHLRSRTDSSDLRNQTEWSVGIGTITRQGMWRFGLSAGFAVGEIDVDYARTKYGTILLIFPFPSSLPQHLQGTYLRPWGETSGGLAYDLSPLPCTIEAGVFARVNAPLLTGHITTDSALDRSGLVVEPGVCISLSLFDVIAVEWIGGIGLPIGSPDWYYEYGTFGVRLMPGR